MPRTSKEEGKERKGEREQEKKRRREGERRRQEMKRRKRKTGRLGRGLPQLRLSTPVIPALERLRRGDQESEDSLGMLVVLVTGTQYLTEQLEDRRVYLGSGFLGRTGTVVGRVSICGGSGGPACPN